MRILTHLPDYTRYGPTCLSKKKSDLLLTNGMPLRYTPSRSADKCEPEGEW